MGKVVTAASAVTVLLLTLSGCTESPPLVPPVPAPSDTPVFASDEEALAAAEAAYAKYTALEDEIAQDGGINPERIEPLVTAEWLTRELESFDNLAAAGRHQVGSTKVLGSELQQVSELQPGVVEVVAYICVDFSATSFVDGSGASVESNAPRLMTVQASFEGDASNLRLAGSEPWPASNC